MTELLLNADFKSSVIIGIASLVAKEDQRNYRISNLTVLSTLSIGLIWITYCHRMNGLATGLSGALVGFALLIPFYALGGLTAGDVKWLAALGAWYGPKGTIGLFIVSGICLGVLSLCWLLASKNPLGCSRNLETAYSSHLRKESLIPYALPVAISVIAIESARILHY